MTRLILLIGVAHLLEHVLYNGDPSGPDKLSEWLQQGGGDSNAATNDENTEFYFYIEGNYENALSSWSKGFNGGSFTKEDIRRELFAVDSEFINAQSEEQWHYQEQIRKCANPKNPFSRFNMGNLQTMPLSKLDQVTGAATNFYKNNYTADKMFLMLVCNKPLDELGQLAKKHFGWYKNSENPETPDKVPSFTNEHLGKIIWLSSQKNKNLLSIIFPIPKETILRF